MNDFNKPADGTPLRHGASGGAKEELEKDPDDAKALAGIQEALEAQRNKVKEDYKLIDEERRP